MKRNFGSRFIKYDKKIGSRIYRDELIAYILEKRRIEAIASHQALFPLPSRQDLNIYPIFFLRHPVDRAISVYNYSRKLEHSRALQNDIKNYITLCLQKGNGTAIKNFHVAKMSNLLVTANNKKTAEATEVHLQEALQRLESCEFFGLVERFDESLSMMKIYLETAFPDIDYTYKEKNVSQDHKISLESRINHLIQTIGDDTYQVLLANNKYDLLLYDFAAKLFQERLSVMDA